MQNTKITKSTVIAGLFLTLILPEVALAKINLQSPYVGISVGIRQNGLYLGQGDNVFKSRQPVGEFFVGLEEVFPSLNLEINIEKIIDRKKQSTLNEGDNLFGQTVVLPVGIRELNLNTKMQFFSAGVDVLYKIKVINCENFSFLFGPGIKIAKLNLSAKNTYTGNETKLSNGNTKTLLKLSAICEYMVTNNYGLRGLVSWENTSVLSPTARNNGYKYTARLKNTISYKLGMLFKF